MSALISFGDNRDQAFRRALAKTMAVSLAAHLVFFTALVVAAGHRRGPSWKDSAIPVSFVAGEVMKAGGTPPKVVKKEPENAPAKVIKRDPPKPKDKPKPKDPPKPKPKKEEPKKIPDKPKDKPKELAKNDVKKPEPPKKPEPEDTEEPLPPPGRDLEIPEVDDPFRDLDDARERINNPGRGNGLGTGDGFGLAVDGGVADGPLGFYQGQVVSLILDNWRLPATVPADPSLQCKVIVLVDKGGKIVDFKIVSPSGNAALDRSVAEVFEYLERVQPPPPAVSSAGPVRLKLNFRPSEL